MPSQIVGLKVIPFNSGSPSPKVWVATTTGISVLSVAGSSTAILESNKFPISTLTGRLYFNSSTQEVYAQSTTQGYGLNSKAFYVLHQQSAGVSGTLTYAYPTGSVHVDRTTDSISGTSDWVPNPDGTEFDLVYPDSAVFTTYYAAPLDAQIPVTVATSETQSLLDSGLESGVSQLLNNPGDGVTFEAVLLRGKALWRVESSYSSPGDIGNILTSDGAGNWVSAAPAGGGSGAPDDAQYWTKSASGGLSDEQLLNSSNPLPVNTGGTGLSTVTADNVLVGNNAGNALGYKSLVSGSGISIAQDSTSITITNTSGGGGGSGAPIGSQYWTRAADGTLTNEQLLNSSNPLPVNTGGTGLTAAAGNSVLAAIGAGNTIAAKTLSPGVGIGITHTDSSIVITNTGSGGGASSSAIVASNVIALTPGQTYTLPAVPSLGSDAKILCFIGPSTGRALIAGSIGADSSTSVLANQKIIMLGVPGTNWKVFSKQSSEFCQVVVTSGTIIVDNQSSQKFFILTNASNVSFTLPSFPVIGDEYEFSFHSSYGTHYEHATLNAVGNTFNGSGTSLNLSGGNTLCRIVWNGYNWNTDIQRRQSLERVSVAQSTTLTVDVNTPRMIVGNPNTGSCTVDFSTLAANPSVSAGISGIDAEWVIMQNSTGGTVHVLGTLQGSFDLTTVYSTARIRLADGFLYRAG